MYIREEEGGWLDAQEIAQQVRTFVSALPEAPGSIITTHMVAWLTAFCNSGSSGSDILFWSQ